MSPLLFVLKHTFEYSFGYFLEEDQSSIKYHELLEKDWLIFWTAKGDETVNSSWIKKYSEYLLKEDEQEKDPGQLIADKSEGDSNNQEEVSSDSSVRIASEVEVYSYSWQDLWDTHYTDIYEKTFELFSIVHYHHFSFYKSQIQNELSVEDLSNSLEEELDFIDQTDQLQALGLPTSFGGSNNKYHKNRLHYSDSDSTNSLSEQEKDSGDLTVEEEEEEDQNQDMAPSQQKQQKKKTSNKNKKNRKLKRMPKFIREDKSLRTYWHKRFSLFSRFDGGIQLDRESWFSVTPEKIAIHMAERLSCDTIIDAFCGSGGNSIQFAFTCSRVIAVDIDPEKIKNARHNAQIYGVANKIEFIIGDYLQLSDGLQGDVVFLSPPWGGPQYISQKEYNIEKSLAPLGATDLANKSRSITENIAFFLPKNSNPKQIAKVAGIGNRVEVEHNYLNSRLVGLTAIYGDWLIDKNNLKDK